MLLLFALTFACLLVVALSSPLGPAVATSRPATSRRVPRRSSTPRSVGPSTRTVAAALVPVARGVARPVATSPEQGGSVLDSR